MSAGYVVSLNAAHPALITARENTVDVLIRVQAPDAPKSGLPERPQLNLAIVIDRSGSMSGHPLHEAKRCAQLMIDDLRSNDRVSVVAYDDEVQVFAESQLATNKEKLKAAVASIHSGSCTNLHGGWLKGAEQVAKYTAPQCISRVLLLSDGNANKGIVDLEEIASQCAQLASKGVSTSTYGLGVHFNEELMMAMARSGRGNGYYSETAESLLERFREEFLLLASLCARDVHLRLSPLPGVRCELLNNYEVVHDNVWRLPDLAYDGEAWAALRLCVNAGILPAVGQAMAILQASVIYRDLSGAECQIAPKWLSMPVMTQEEFQKVATDETVIRRIQEAEAARLQVLASRAAKRQNWNEVADLLRQARTLAADNPWLGEIVANLEGLAALQDAVLFSKEASYAASSMSSRLRSKDELNPSFNEDAAPSFLQRKVRQGATAPPRRKEPPTR